MMLSRYATERLHRLIHHFQNGSVGDRLVWEIEKWRAWSKMSTEQRRAERRRLRWVRAGTDAGYADARVKGGARLRLYTDSALAGSIYKEWFEQIEQVFLWRYLRPGDIFADVGANIGLYTVISAKRVGPKGKVYSFEPAALPRQRLQENIRLNRFGNVNILPLALSDKDGWLDIYVPMDGHDAWSSLAKPILGRDIKTDRVEAIAWDTFAERNKVPRPTMMKIDVEGWEGHVLKGAIATLSAVEAPLLQVEFTDEAAQAAGSSCADLYRQLLDFGYMIYRYEPASNRLIPAELRKSYPYDNLYATKHLDSDNRRLAGMSRYQRLREKLKQAWPIPENPKAAE